MLTLKWWMTIDWKFVFKDDHPSEEFGLGFPDESVSLSLGRVRITSQGETINKFINNKIATQVWAFNVQLTRGKRKWLKIVNNSTAQFPVGRKIVHCNRYFIQFKWLKSSSRTKSTWPNGFQEKIPHPFCGFKNRKSKIVLY